jgi:hypothetical protein
MVVLHPPDRGCWSRASPRPPVGFDGPRTERTKKGYSGRESWLVRSGRVESWLWLLLFVSLLPLALLFVPTRAQPHAPPPAARRRKTSCQVTQTCNEGSILTFFLGSDWFRSGAER